MQWEYNWSQGYTPSDHFVGGFAATSPVVRSAHTPKPGVVSSPYNQVAFPAAGGPYEASRYVSSPNLNRGYESDHHSRHHHHHDHNEGHRSRSRSNSHSNHHSHHHHHHHRSHSRSRAEETVPQFAINGVPVSSSQLQVPQSHHQKYREVQPQPLPSQPVQYQHLQYQHLQSRHPQSQHLQSQHLQSQHLRSQPLQSQEQVVQSQPQSFQQAQPQYGPQADGQRGIRQQIQRMIPYSKCNGNKKAVCIGINYDGQKNELKGCVNDAKNIHKFLTSKCGFKPQNIRMLIDETHDNRILPTRANMLAAMKWLVQGAKAHDSLFFHYSGHGGQIPDLDGDETDGYDEVIFPLDYEKNGIISDDDLNLILAHPLPDGCRLTALFDSCHSGSVLDLIYEYHSNGKLKQSQVSPSFRAQKTSIADVISFSGCDDSQTSADTYKNGLAVGAMSYAFVKCLTANPKQTYIQLLRGVREILNNQYSQKPQLSSSHRIDINLQFVL